MSNCCRLQKELTGVDDLEDIKFLEMRVDTMETSLGNFGKFCYFECFQGLFYMRWKGKLL